MVEGQQVKEGPPCLRIVSWNVNGVATTLKEVINRYGTVEHFFEKEIKADIVCIQEAKIQEEKLEKWLALVPGFDSYWAFSREKKGYSGVATYVKEACMPLDACADCLGTLSGQSEDIDREGRVICTDHGSFILVNVYVPNAGEKPLRPRIDFKMKFLRMLRNKCDGFVRKGKHVIIVGDLNISHKDADVHRSFNFLEMYSPAELAWMDELMKDYVDLFRYFHPYSTNAFSCWDQRNDARSRNEGVRIDYTICDKGFLPQIVTADILNLPKKWSDHTAVTVTLLEQPCLADHPRPKLSATNIKQLREDRRQKRLTSLFVRKPAAGSDASANSPTHPAIGNMALTTTRSGLSHSLAESDTRESGSLTISADNKATDANANELMNLSSQAVHGPIEAESPLVVELDSALAYQCSGGRSSHEMTMGAADSHQAADATNAAQGGPAFIAVQGEGRITDTDSTFSGDADDRAGRTCTTDAIKRNGDRSAGSEPMIRQSHGFPGENRMPGPAEKSVLPAQAHGVSTSVECVPDDNQCVLVSGGSPTVCEGEAKAVSRHSTGTEWKDDSERKDVGDGGHTGSMECPKKAVPAEMEGVEKMAGGGGRQGKDQVGKDAEQCEVEKVSEVNVRTSHDLRGSYCQQHPDLLDDEERQVVLRPNTLSSSLLDTKHLLEGSVQGNLVKVSEQGNPLKAADQKRFSKPADTQKNPINLSDDQIVSQKAGQGPRKAGATRPKSSLSGSDRAGAKQRGIETFFSPIGGKPMPGAPVQKRQKL